MFKKINIKNKEYIFLPNLLHIYRYDKKIMDIYNDIENGKICENNETYKRIEELIQNENKNKFCIDNVKKDYYGNEEIFFSGCDINLLYECNLRCRYCFVNENHNNSGGVLSKDEAKKILDYIFERLSEKKRIIITLMGGEPLLNIDVFKEILIYGNYLGKKYDKQVKFITTTNAVYLDDKKLSILEQFNVGFIMSLDSQVKEINDYLRLSNENDISVYEKVFEVIEKVKDRIDIHINVTITPYNLDIYDTATFLYDKGVKNIHFYLCDSDREDMLFDNKHIEKLKKEFEKICDYIIQKNQEGLGITCQPLMDNMEKLHKKKPVIFPCSILKSRLAFDYEGNIYPCIVLMEEDTLLGNINTEINHKKLIQFKDIILKEDECKYCWARNLCGGKCLGSKLWENKEQKNMRCDLKRHIFALRIYMYDYIITNKLGHIFSWD